MKVYIKHQIRKLELNIVNVAIIHHAKLISKIISFFFTISCVIKDIIKTKRGVGYIFDDDGLKEVEENEKDN